MQNRILRHAIVVIFFIAVASIIAVVIGKRSAPDPTEDIYHIFQEGQRITQGINPYSRIIGSDMLVNDKYPTYFPGFYLAVALSNKLGLATFEQWFSWWVPLNGLFAFMLGILIFILLERLRMPLVYSLFSVAFCLLNRWSLYVIISGQIDILALLFLMAGCALVKHRHLTADLLLGTSLVIKQLAIFLVPLWLLWRLTGGHSTVASSRRGIFSMAQLREVFQVALGVALIPFLLSAPFLMQDPQSFLSCIFFSVTRQPESHFGVQSLDDLLNLIGGAAKLPMLFMMAVTYLLAWQQVLRKYASVLLIMMIFANFNSVFFKQYFVWAVVFLPLALAEYLTPQAQSQT